MAKHSNDPTPGKWTFAKGGQAKAARLHGHEARRGVGSRTAAQVKSLRQQSDAARRGRN